MKLKISKCETSPANRVYLLDTLPDIDLQTGRSKYERILDEVLAKYPEDAELIPKKVFLRKCSDLTSLLAAFDEVAAECSVTTSPLVFVDGHGHETLGLQLKSGGFLGWGEFNNGLEAISRAASGHQTVIAAFCHSMSALKAISYEKPLPAPFYYGYLSEISAGDIETEGRLIVTSLLRHGRFDSNGLKLTLHSEYDHAMQQISLLAAKFLRPQEYASDFPELSIGNLRKRFRSDIGREFGRTDGLNRVLSEALDIRKITGVVLSRVMYDTERRTELEEELVAQFNEELERLRKTVPTKSVR